MAMFDVKFDGRKLKALRQEASLSVEDLLRRLSAPGHDYTYEVSALTIMADERTRGKPINVNRMRAYCRFFVKHPGDFAWNEAENATEAEAGSTSIEKPVKPTTTGEVV